MLNKIKKIDPWLAMFYGGLLGIFIWAVLKSLEIIKSPAWQEMIPVFMAILAAIGVVKYIFKYLLRIEIMDHRLFNVENGLKNVDKRLINVEGRLIRVETDMTFIKSKV